MLALEEGGNKRRHCRAFGNYTKALNNNSTRIIGRHPEGFSLYEEPEQVFNQFRH